MKLSIDPSVFRIDENIKLGLNHYTKFVVSEAPQMLKGRMQLFQENLFFDLQNKDLTDYEGISEWRNVWKSFGADSSRHRPSMEAMIRRIRNQNYLQPVNGAVDINNFFSLQYEIPVGLYDCSKIAGNIELHVGSNETNYMGINGRHNTLKGILTLFDSKGPFGSPYVDSVRTSINEGSTEALQIFFLKPSMKTSDAEQLLESAGRMFVQVNGGDYTSHILNKQQVKTSIDSMNE